MPGWHMGGEEVELLLILILGTRWGWVVNITPRPRFTPGEEPTVPIGQEAGWDPEPVWTQRQEEKSSASVGDQNPVVQSVVSHFSKKQRCLCTTQWRHGSRGKDESMLNSVIRWKWVARFMFQQIHLQGKNPGRSWEDLWALWFLKGRARDLLTIWATIIFSRRSVLHGHLWRLIAHEVIAYLYKGPSKSA
jgi:hypothetical protein